MIVPAASMRAYLNPVLWLGVLWLFCAPTMADQARPDANTGQTDSRLACIYDPTGANAFVSALFDRYAQQAEQWGYRFKTRRYLDENVAARDFKAGHCDLVMLTGVRSHDLVSFAGSLDMAGGLQTYAQERQAIRAMSAPRAASLMRADGQTNDVSSAPSANQAADQSVTKSARAGKRGNTDVVVAGVVPLGKVFLFARDRRDLASLDRMAGKNLAILRYDRQARVLADTIGASPVPTTITGLGPAFNNGSASLTYAPAIAYDALELKSGLAQGGGVADFVLGMLSGQMLIHADRFDSGYAQHSRTWVAEHMLEAGEQLARQAERAIPASKWVAIDAEQTRRYRHIFLKVREQLWEEHWYSHRMQHLLKKIRCASTPALAECSQPSEGGPAL